MEGFKMMRTQMQLFPLKRSDTGYLKEEANLIIKATSLSRMLRYSLLIAWSLHKYYHS